MRRPQCSYTASISTTVVCDHTGLVQYKVEIGKGHGRWVSWLPATEAVVSCDPEFHCERPVKKM